MMDLSITVLMATAALGGLYMAWNIGANDVANAMGTSVGSGALTLRRAVIIAAIFEFSGALLVGGTVTDTIRSGFIDPTTVGIDSLDIAVGMTCCLLATASWLNVATWKGWPVSTTHSTIGAVVGFGLVAGGFEAVTWTTVGQVAASWIISPIMGGLLAYGTFKFIHRRILDSDRPLAALRAWGPLMVFPIFTVLSLSFIFKGLKPLRLDFGLAAATLIALGIGTAATLLSIPVFNQVTREVGLKYEGSRRPAERVFMVLQVITACFVAFAHGSNDVANAVGPLAAVFGALTVGVTQQVSVPLHILMIGAIGITIGLATYGYRVIETVGKGITELTPSRGFAAEFAAATTIVMASKLGMPVSTTHTLVGCVVGVGMARSISAINKQVLKGIVTSWLITVPISASLSAVLYLVARFLI